MKTISATTAILLAINEFGDTPFSIYDITRTIRNNVRDEEYELRYEFDNVEHDNIKSHFTELLDNNLLDGYYTRFNSLGYREFCKTIPTSTTQPTSDPTTVVQSAMAATNIPTDVQLKIYSYLKNRGDCATMKQIQSTLKGHRYTCEEIRDFLGKINLVEPQSSIYPVSQQWTVKI